MKVSFEMKVSKSLLKKIELGTKFTLTTKDIDGKKHKQILEVDGICHYTGVIDLS